jgi:hypothetical protein
VPTVLLRPSSSVYFRLRSLHHSPKERSEPLLSLGSFVGIARQSGKRLFSRISFFHGFSVRGILLVAFLWLFENNTVVAQDKMVWENRGVLAAVSEGTLISSFIGVLSARIEIQRSLIFVQQLDFVIIQDRVRAKWPLHNVVFPRRKFEFAGVVVTSKCQESFLSKIAKIAGCVSKIPCDSDGSGILDLESKNWTLSWAQGFQDAIMNDDIRALVFSNCFNHLFRSGVQVILGGKENADAQAYADSYCPPESKSVIALLPVMEREGKSYDEKYREEDQGQNRAHEMATVFLALYAFFFGMVICFFLAVICDNRKV